MGVGFPSILVGRESCTYPRVLFSHGTGFLVKPFRYFPCQQAMGRISTTPFSPAALSCPGSCHQIKIAVVPFLCLQLNQCLMLSRGQATSMQCRRVRQRCHAPSLRAHPPAGSPRRGARRAPMCCDFFSPVGCRGQSHRVGRVLASGSIPKAEQAGIAKHMQAQGVSGGGRSGHGQLQNIFLKFFQKFFSSWSPAWPNYRLWLGSTVAGPGQTNAHPT